MEHSSFNAEIVRTPNCFDRIYDQHCHTHFEVLFVLEGSIKLNVEGAHILLEKDTGIIIEPLKYHIVTGNNTAYHRLIIFFEQDFIPLQIRGRFLGNIRDNYVFSSESLAQLFRKYSAVLEKGDPAYALLLDAILTESIYALAMDERIHAESPDSKRTGKLKQIISFIDENMDREILLEDIAARMYMSQSAVCHLFKEEMNISLKQYILQKKMIYAKSLLSQGVSPGEAAAACGYKNYASFYKIFLKITGKSPAKVLPKG